MRTALPSRLLRFRHVPVAASSFCTARPAVGTVCKRTFAKVRDTELLDDKVWVSQTSSRAGPAGLRSDHRPPDERTLKLGKSMFKHLEYEELR